MLAGLVKTDQFQQQRPALSVTSGGGGGGAPMLDKKVSLGKAWSSVIDDVLTKHRSGGSGGDSGREQDGWKPLDAALDDLTGREGTGVKAAPRRAPATLALESIPGNSSVRREAGGAAGNVSSPQGAVAVVPSTGGRSKIKNFKDLMRIAHKNVMAASSGQQVMFAGDCCHLRAPQIDM